MRLSRQRVGSILFDVFVSAVVVSLTALPMLAQPLPWVLWLPGAGMATVLLVRRRWPLTVMGVVATQPGQRPVGQSRQVDVSDVDGTGVHSV